MEDFPTHFHGSAAANLLACWTAAWHPALLATTQHRPVWQSVDFVELESSDALIFIPNVCRPLLGQDFYDSVARLNATEIPGDLNRSQMLEIAIDQNEAAAAVNAIIAPELSQDFLALGYAFLQIQLMTRQLRYSSNLDEADFFDGLLAAATTASRGNMNQAKTELTRCFDLLQTEKNSYYPVQPELIDMVLVAPTTLGTSLDRQLKRDHRLNILLSGFDANALELKNPSATMQIRNSIESQQIAIIGGLESEVPDPLVSSETVVRQLFQGRETLERIFGVAPKVFARRSFGLSPGLPGLLDQLDFVGAIHATFDDGQFPRGSSSNIRWTGFDGESILAYGDLPLNAEDPGSLLGLGKKIGEAIDSAHVATILFAHWPGRNCESFDDLLRVCDYGQLLGNFISLEDYFEQTYDPGYGDTFTADEYKQPYLKRAIAQQDPHPISRIVDYWKNYYRLAGCRALFTQLTMISSLLRRDSLPASLPDSLFRLEELETRLDLSAQENFSTDSRMAAAVSEFEDGLLSALGELIRSKHPDSTAVRCLANTTHSSRRCRLLTGVDDRIAAKSSGTVVFADSGTEQTNWVLEVPGMASLSLPHSGMERPDPFRRDPPVLHGKVLCNEFFELEIDERTGGIRSLNNFESRDNLVSQRLALRIPGADNASNPRLTAVRYAEMVADEIESTSNSRIEAQITSRGRLIDNGASVARFEQTVRVTRGIRVFEIEIEINPEIKLTDSINYYFCSRLAWKDESTQVICNSQESKSIVTSDWFLATNFIEMQQSAAQVTLLTGGLPYHRRTSRRMLDSLLIVGNEQQRKFRLGIGTPLSYPLAAAQSWLTPLLEFETQIKTGNNSVAGWLFHFDCKNILVTWWQPIIESNLLTGVHVRLRETEGRAGKLTIACCRKLKTAEKVNFSGDFLRTQELDTAADKLSVQFVAWDYLQIKLNWET